MSLNLTQTILTQIAFKRLSGKAMTSGKLSLAEEALGSSTQASNATIFGQALPNNPEFNTAADYKIQSASVGDPGTVQRVIFNLTPIEDTSYENNTGVDIGSLMSSSATNFNQNAADIQINRSIAPRQGFNAALGDPTSVSTFHAYAVNLPSNYQTVGGSNVGFDTYAGTGKSIGDAPFINSFMSTGSVQFQVVPEFVSTITGENNPYIAQVTASNGAGMSTTHAVDYYFDTFAGIVFVQDPIVAEGTSSPNQPGTLKAFLYVGKYQSEIEGDSVDLHFSASEGTGFSFANNATASFTSGSGEGLTVTAGATNNIEFELVNVVSSSAQILDGTGILSSSLQNFTQYSSSVETLIIDATSSIAVNETNIATNVTNIAYATASITVNETNIATNTADITLLEASASAGIYFSASDSGTSVGLMETASFVAAGGGGITVTENAGEITTTLVSVISSSQQVQDNLNGVSLFRISSSAGTDDIDLQFGQTASFIDGGAGLTIKATGNSTKTVEIGAVGDKVTFNQITGSNLLITNTASISYLHTTYETASVIYSSGSTKFGNSIDDNHWFTGSMLITGSTFEFVGLAHSAERTPLVIDSAGVITTGSAYALSTSGMSGFNVSGSTGGFTVSDNGLINLNSGSGEGLTVVASSTDLVTFTLVGVLSSSAQIATDISGAFTAASNSIAGDINTNITNIATNVTNIASATASITVNETNIATNVTNIASATASITVNETNIANLVVNSASFSADIDLLEASASAGIYFSASDSGTSIPLLGTASFVAAGGGGITVTENAGEITTTLVNVISSSAQLPSGILSSSLQNFTEYSSSVETLISAATASITVNETNIATNITNIDLLEASASAGIYFSGSVGGGVSIPLTNTASFVGGAGITTTFSGNGSTGIITISSDTGELTSPVAVSASNGITSLAYGGTASFEAAGAGLAATQAGGVVTYTLTPDDVLNGATDATTFNFTSSNAVSASYALSSSYAVTASYALNATNVDVVNNNDNSYKAIVFADPATGASQLQTDNAALRFNPGLGTNGTLRIDGDLIVEGTTTTINSQNLLVEDPFILLASGSNTNTVGGGIIIERSAQNIGTALFWDEAQDVWAVDLAGADATSALTKTIDFNLVGVKQASGNPSTAPAMGQSNYKLGQMYVNTTDSDSDGNTIWIYAT